MQVRKAGIGGLMLTLVLMGQAAWGQKPAEDISPRAEAMLAKLLLKYRQYKTFAQTMHGKINVTADGVKISADMQTTIRMAQPNRFRIESVVDFFGTQQHGLSVSDGKTAWEWNADGQEYSEQPLTELVKNEDKFTHWLIDRTGADVTPAFFMEAASGHILGITPDAEASISVEDYPKTDVDGHPMYRIPMPIDETDGTRGTATLYVDPTDMLVHRCRFVMKSPQGKEDAKDLNVEMVFTYDEIKLNPEFSDSLFTFTPPDGAKKAEMVKTAFDRAFDK